MKITKALIPAAGRGTRFAPYTQVIAKEMLPLITKPAIHHSIEEGVLSGITDFGIITNSTKESLSQYCDILEKQNYARFAYIRQQEARGLGHAIWTARNLIHNEYFGVMLPDDIVAANIPCLQQLIAIAQKENSSVIALQKIPHEKISAYGVVKAKNIDNKLYSIETVIEKPLVHEAPSNLAIVGRYVFSPTILSILENTPPSNNGEIQLTDAITELITRGEKVLGYVFEGTRYDTGTPHGWVQAVTDYAKKEHYL